MNEVIVSLFRDFTVEGEAVPVRLLHYEGHGEPYVTFQLVGTEGALYGDDRLLETVAYYDFDVYKKGDYTAILSALRAALEGAGFTWQPDRSSGDLYEPETGYYHRTMQFAIDKKEES